MSKIAFITYGGVASLVILTLIFGFSSRYGARNPFIFIAICSLAGSISVMAAKGLGIAIELTIEGNNQAKKIAPYVFGAVCVTCILIQLNFINKVRLTSSCLRQLLTLK
jgi:hypothetical protein